MLRWTPYVMVRICLSFVAGILAGIYFPQWTEERWIIIGLLVLIPAYFIVYFSLRDRESVRSITGVIGLTAIFLFGILHLLINTQSRSEHHLLSIGDKIEYYEAIVRSAPESKARSWKVEVEVNRVKTGEWRPVTGKVLLYVSKKSVDRIPWLYGDRLLIKGSPVELSTPANPHEFNFKRFLGFKNIYHQQFILFNQIKELPRVEEKGVFYYTSKARAWAVSQLTRFVKGEQQQAIAMALVLGVTEGIDTDLQNAYAASGAMHVLAVSGLHVGILYSIILLLFKPLDKFAWSRWVIFVASVIILWSFAFVTGLSPSVQRAVTMFSFIAFSRPLGWKTNIYNTLAGSAFVLLFINPYLVMSVGFQLSYLAVLGIVYLQRPIYSLWEVEDRVGDWIWQISSVSIAAQASTFALGMLYFHQFPVYFLVSNLFVIPLATVILISGIVVLGVALLSSFLAQLTGLLVTTFIHLLNGIVFYVESLPFSIVEEIYLTTSQCWLIMLIILGMLFLFEFRKIQWLYVALACGCGLVIEQLMHMNQTGSKSQFIVYSVNGHSAFEWIENSTGYFRADSSLLLDRERIRFHIRPNRLYHGVSRIYHDIPFQRVIEKGLVLYRWRNTSIVHWNVKDKPLPGSIEIDYLVVGKNSFQMDLLDKAHRIKKIILDGSNSRAYARRLKAIASGKNIPVHYVLDDTAFVITEFL
jgi:competence protein ComEC